MSKILMLKINGFIAGGVTKVSSPVACFESHRSVKFRFIVYNVCAASKLSLSPRPPPETDRALRKQPPPPPYLDALETASMLRAVVTHRSMSPASGSLAVTAERSAAATRSCS